VAATAAAHCPFSELLDALGVQADSIAPAEGSRAGTRRRLMRCFYVPYALTKIWEGGEGRRKYVNDLGATTTVRHKQTYLPV